MIRVGGAGEPPFLFAAKLAIVPVAFYPPVMPRDGAMTLSDVRQPALELICEQCGRRGRYNVVGLQAKHGDAKLPGLAAQFADCPKARNASIYDRCKVHWAAWQ
jgi:hypothetical protein